MDKYLENVIEITQVYDALMREGKLDDDVDSLDYKVAICDYAKEFEEINKDVFFDGGERDYYIEIEEFATKKLIEDFGREEVDNDGENEYKTIFLSTEIGQLYMMCGDSGFTKYVEIGIGVKDKLFLPIYAIEVMKKGAKCIDLYEGEYDSDGEYEGLDLVKEVNLEELNDRALKRLDEVMR